MAELVARIREAAERRDFQLLAELLWIPLPKCPPSRMSEFVRSRLASGTVFSSSKSTMAPTNVPYAVVLEEHFGLLEALGRGETESSSVAFKHSVAALQALLKTLPSEGLAEVPLLKRLCTNVFHLSLLADQQSPSASASHGEEGARLLSRAFTTAITDRNPLAASKKWAALHISNLLFRLYFRLGTVRLCTNILRAVETTMGSGDFPSLSAFPRAESVTFQYFRARLAINENNFKAAEEHLTDAVQRCSSQFASQKRELLTYLILVRMIHGHLPHPDLLLRHHLEGPYGLLSRAVRTGDLRLFSQVLEENQSFYMKKQLYLIIQMQLRNLILRSFLKRLYLIGLSRGVHGENRLSLRLVETAFQTLGISEMTLDEVECITANLIYTGFVKGYISHEKSLVVLSKKNAFPAPSTFL